VEVHVRISAPPVKWPCFYGIDFATRAELIASGLDNEGIRRSIGADTLGYVSLAGLVTATEQPRTRLCRACFDGDYPIELPAGNVIGKHVLEGVGKRAAVPEDQPGEGVGATELASPAPKVEPPALHRS
jgi:amidophosphoribosyltransferase